MCNNLKVKYEGTGVNFFFKYKIFKIDMFLDKNNYYILIYYFITIIINNNVRGKYIYIMSIIKIKIDLFNIYSYLCSKNFIAK